MSAFKFPSHSNSTNERRARRANWKTGGAKNKRIIGELTELARLNTVTKADHGYTVKTLLSSYEITDTPAGLHCCCSDKRDLGTCSHIIAAEDFAAGCEAAKQLKITAARQALENFYKVRERENFHYQAGENELHYENIGHWEGA